MKILVSAFACNPYQGSEPGVGWAAVKRISEFHDVYLLTDSHNREGLKKANKEGLLPPNLKIRILRKNTRYSRNRFIARIQSWLWYVSYCRLVLKEAIEWHQDVNFDLCHQVTIAAWRVPSPLWQLPIPFIWGPVGGAGYIPPKFRSIMNFQARIFERARDLSSFITLRSKSFRQCAANTDVVISANEETKELIAPYRMGKPLIKLPIVSLSQEKIVSFQLMHAPKRSGPVKIFAGGTLIGSKGIALALNALNHVAREGIEFHYTIAGGGPDLDNLRRITSRLGLNEKVTFHPGYSGSDYINTLQQSEIFLLPSFREGTPVTMIEACIAGCYPVVLDTSAQGELVDMIGGSSISLTSIKGIINDLAKELISCISQRQQLFDRMEHGRSILCNKFHANLYQKVINKAYTDCANRE